MKLQPALIFGEGMILQRDKEIRIWGTSAQNDTVTVKTCVRVELLEEVPEEGGDA